MPQGTAGCRGLYRTWRHTASATAQVGGMRAPNGEWGREPPTKEAPLQVCDAVLWQVNPALPAPTAFPLALCSLERLVRPCNPGLWFDCVSFCLRLVPFISSGHT